MASNKLQKKDYTRASLRAYFLQNGMNYSNYQGLGYANMLYPGLRKIYDDDDQLRDALKENVEFFNTNPSMVPFIGNLHLAMLDGGANAKEVKSIKIVVVKHFCNTLFENSPGISSFKWCFPIIVGMRTDMIVPYVHISV